MKDMPVLGASQIGQVAAYKRASADPKKTNVRPRLSQRGANKEGGHRKSSLRQNPEGKLPAHTRKLGARSAENQQKEHKRMDAETALPAKRVNGRMWQRSLLFRLTKASKEACRAAAAIW